MSSHVKKQTQTHLSSLPADCQYGPNMLTRIPSANRGGVVHMRVTLNPLTHQSLASEQVMRVPTSNCARNPIASSLKHNIYCMIYTSRAHGHIGGRYRPKINHRYASTNP